MGKKIENSLFFLLAGIGKCIFFITKKKRVIDKQPKQCINAAIDMDITIDIRQPQYCSQLALFFCLKINDCNILQ